MGENPTGYPPLARERGMVRYGLIGMGFMGREHLTILAHLKDEGATVTCISDPHIPSQQRAVEMAASYNWPLQVFSTHHELLDSGLCDVVVVSTPNMTHCQMLVDILNHPKPHHAHVEKPLCTTMKDCKKVIEAAKRRPEILVQVGMEYRYMPPVAKLLDIAREGTLGNVKMVAIRLHHWPFRASVNNWNRFNSNTGGTLVEYCCHFFDLMRQFTSANPVRAMASGAMDVNHKNESYDGKVPDIMDNAFVIIEFDNDSRGMLDFCLFGEGSKYRQEISVVGDLGKGEAFLPDVGDMIVNVGSRAGGRDGVKTLIVDDDRIKHKGFSAGSAYLQHLNFLASVKNKGRSAPGVGLNDGLMAMALGVAAQLSIEKRRFVTIEEVMNE